MSVLLAVLSALLQAIGALFDVLVKGATGIAASGRGGFDVLDPSSLAAPARSTPFLLSLPAYLVGLVLVQLAFAVGRASAEAALVAIGATVLPIGFACSRWGRRQAPPDSSASRSCSPAARCRCGGPGLRTGCPSRRSGCAASPRARARARRCGSS
jgi:hypothetical protein